MRKRVTIVLVCTLAAVTLACLVPPASSACWDRPDPTGVLRYGWPGDTRWVPVWDLGWAPRPEEPAPRPPPPPGQYFSTGSGPDGWLISGRWIVWPLLLAEVALILLLGGGVLTWVVRRERRRRAASVEA